MDLSSCNALPISEVLQVEAIFSNVSKGVLANRKDVEKAFGMQNQDEVIRFILEKGIVQVSEKERKAQQEETFRDIATIISVSEGHYFTPNVCVIYSLPFIFFVTCYSIIV